MEILNTVFTFVSNNILTKAEFFVGLIVLVGYILLGRKWYETLAGFLKAVVGYMILNVGSAGLINTCRWSQLFGSLHFCFVFKFFYL